MHEISVRIVRAKKRLDLTAQGIVTAGCGSEERRALVRRPFEDGVKERLYLVPACVGHGRPSIPSSRASHALAARHSRLAVEGETLSTCAASSIVKPPNARSSTIVASW